MTLRCIASAFVAIGYVVASVVPCATEAVPRSQRAAAERALDGDAHSAHHHPGATHAEAAEPHAHAAHARPARHRSGDFALSMPCPCGCGKHGASAATGGKLGPRLVPEVEDMQPPESGGELASLEGRFATRTPAVPDPVPIFLLVATPIG